MVEYWITNVEVEDNKIKDVTALTNTIEGLSNPVKYTKQEIIKSIETTDDHWYTATLKETRGARNIWEKGLEIHIIETEGKKFIRTDKNEIKNDSLDNQPTRKK